MGPLYRTAILSLHMAASLARPSAYYAAPVSTFLAAAADEVLGALAAAHTFDLEVSQRLAWQEEIEILKTSLDGLSGTLYLEFDVPAARQPDRRRADLRAVHRPDRVQVRRARVPHRGLQPGVGLRARPQELPPGEPRRADPAGARGDRRASTGIRRGSLPTPTACVLPSAAAQRHLRAAIDEGARRRQTARRSTVRPGARALYEPTPTIIEAARALYARHSVRGDLAARRRRQEPPPHDRRDRGDHRALPRQRREGDRLRHRRARRGQDAGGPERRDAAADLGEARAVYLSGNGPLVAVLQEALTRDEFERAGQLRAQGRDPPAGEAVHPERPPLPRRGRAHGGAAVRPRGDLRRGAARVGPGEDRRLHEAPQEDPGLRPLGAGVPHLVPRPPRHLGRRRLPRRRRPGDPHRRGRHRRVAGGGPDELPALARLRVAEPHRLGVRGAVAPRAAGRGRGDRLRTTGCTSPRRCGRSARRRCRRSSRPSSTAR